MDRLHAMAVFVKVVELGSFARAAERLDISTSACSRLVAELEQHLDTRLLNRTTRRLSLTETGRDFHARAVEILAELDEAEQAARARAARPSGRLRVNAAVIFGERHLAPLAGEFLALHPDVTLDLTLVDRVVDIVEEGFDCAIRIGGTGSLDLVARKLATTRSIVCASPAYLKRHGTPQRPADLLGHNCLRYTYLSAEQEWRFTDTPSLAVRGTLESNHGGFLCAAAVSGVGIATLPSFIAGPEVIAGRLVPILAEYVQRPIPIHGVYPTRKHVPAKVRAFLDFLAERWADGGEWERACTDEEKR